MTISQMPACPICGDTSRIRVAGPTTGNVSLDVAMWECAGCWERIEVRRPKLLRYIDDIKKDPELAAAIREALGIKEAGRE